MMMTSCLLHIKTKVSNQESLNFPFLGATLMYMFPRINP